MNDQQIARIDNEIAMLNKKLEVMIKPINPQIENYIWGKIDSLKWVKENL